MGAVGEEELKNWEKMQGEKGGEEKILVSVRLRPLSEKEIAKSEVSDWECINETTVLYRNSLQERSGLPSAYTFDRVFRGDCSTREVYEEGTKDIALSVVTGINSTIFAYGQTSSGKTYTMNGITEYAVVDIYDYIQRHEERAFVLKFSAMEIYNEVVRDLLSTDDSSLRLLDDPERGTVIEKLTEATLRDRDHLKELLSICEAQRQVGETSLNETSSRSHQILRLTIESSAREFLGKDNSTTLTASVNFVDLAGSERASQASSVGQRLKEGCHINRSLLTLGTVIRKLSKGRQGHVNYRDSKLTRILQSSLGGNARTAIICTLSPARTHVEQSRNTLLFASCAKEVSTNALVNVVMSDKALVKHLQKELARLESELRNPGPPGDYGALIRKKDLQIEKLEKEVKELTKQRDLAESRLEDLLRTVRDDDSSKERDVGGVNSKWKEENTDEDKCSVSGSSIGGDSFQHPVENNDDQASSIVILPTPHRKSYGVSISNAGKERFSHGTIEDSDGTCKEVQCVEIDESPMDKTSGYPSSDRIIEGSTSRLMVSRNGDLADSETLSTAATPQNSRGNGSTNGILEKQFQDPYPCKPSPSAQSINMFASGSPKLSRSQSCKDTRMTDSNVYEREEQGETTPPNGSERNYPGRPEGGRRKQWNVPPVIYGADSVKLGRNDSQSSNGSAFVDEHKHQQNNAGDEDILSVDTFFKGLKEMAKLHLVQEKEELEDGKSSKGVGQGPLLDDPSAATAKWQMEFEKMQRAIIELWKTCHVSLIHRTYFFVLFKGDPMDSIYLEVEHRRLSYLKEMFSKGNPVVQNGQKLTSQSSLKALQRERGMLSRLLHRRFTEDERNTLYERWGISLNSKQRKSQLVQRLWSNTRDMVHVTESAAIVAKLVRFSEQGQTLKEMFGLSFTPQSSGRRSFGWKNRFTFLL